MQNISFFSLIAIFTSLLSLGSAATYTNAIRTNSADPHMVWVDGYYYLTNTQGTHISITKATTLAGLQNNVGETKEVWRDSDKTRNQNTWAPEMHKIDGNWYIFYTSGDGNGGSQRSRIIKGRDCSANPFDCTYDYLTALVPPSGKQGGSNGNNPWSIDGTYLTIGPNRFHVCSAHNGSGVQSINIAALDTSDFTIGPWHIISEPTEPWETDASKGNPKAVNEGPNALYHGSRTWLSFSASYCATKSYSLGLLAYDGTGNPLDRKSWTKSGPALKSANGDFGTGHNVFFSSPDGKEIFNAFHATNHSDGSCGTDRFTFAQKVTFDKDNNPDLGVPVKWGTVLQGPSGEPSS